MRILCADPSAVFQAEFARVLERSGLHVRRLRAAASLAELGASLAVDDYDLCVVLRGLLAEAPAEALAMLGETPFLVLADEDPDGGPNDSPGADDLLKAELSPALLRHAVRSAVRSSAAERAARKAETLLQLVQEAAGIATWDWDVRTGAVRWSPNLFRLLGVPPGTPEDRLFGCWRAAVHPDDRAAHDAGIAAALEGTAPWDMRLRMLRPASPGRGNGGVEVRWIACRGEVLRDAEGRAIRMVGVNFDDTDTQLALLEAERRRTAAEGARRHSERRFRTVFDNAPDCMFEVTVQPGNRFVYHAVNPAAVAITHTSAEAFAGHSPEEVLGPVKGGEMTEGLRRVCETGQNFQYQPVWDLPGGSVSYDATYMPVHGEDGGVVSILGLARDTTAEQRLRAAVHQAQKVKSLGQLVGGVAHDFNNVLAAVQSCLLLLRKRHAAPADALLEEGLGSVRRGKALTDRLLGFARQKAGAVRHLDAAAVIRAMDTILQRALGPGVQLRYELEDSLPAIRVDQSELELTLLNLVINARDAMPEGGTLTLRARRAPEEAAEPPAVLLDVVDTGIGMAPEILARAREPFFTTKADGEGTGLGLGLADALARQLGGSLDIRSELGRGTTVSLRLPASARRGASAGRNRGALPTTD